MGCLCPAGSNIKHKKMEHEVIYHAVKTYPDLQTDKKMLIAHDPNGNFVEIPQLTTIDLKMVHAIDEMQINDPDYTKQVLLSLSFELKSYINYFDFIMGRSLNNNSNNDMEMPKCSSIKAYGIEPKSYRDGSVANLLLPQFDGIEPRGENSFAVTKSNGVQNDPISDDEAIKDNVFFIKNMFTNPQIKEAKMFLIEIQRGKYIPQIPDLKTFELKNPFVEIELIVLSTQRETVVNTKYQTKKVKNVITPVWQEFHCFNLKELSGRGNFNIDLESSSFSIRFFYQVRGKDKKKFKQLGHEQRFSLKELTDQRVHDKTLTFKNLETKELYGQLAFRCQLIYDHVKLMERVRSEMETKVETIKLSLDNVNNGHHGGGKKTPASASFISTGKKERHANDEQKMTTAAALDGLKVSVLTNGTEYYVS